MFSQPVNITVTTDSQKCSKRELSFTKNLCSSEINCLINFHSSNGDVSIGIEDATYSEP